MFAKAHIKRQLCFGKTILCTAKAVQQMIPKIIGTFSIPLNIDYIHYTSIFFPFMFTAFFCWSGFKHRTSPLAYGDIKLDPH